MSIPETQIEIEQLVALLRAQGATLSLAESCTGGLVSSRIAALAGVSDVYLGGVVAYANAAKIEILDVAESVLRQSGAVSAQTALAMATGARARFQSAWAASITGIAGPSGGTPQKPVGTVCFAVCGPGVEWTKILYLNGDRAQIQDQSARFIVQVLITALKAGSDGLVQSFDA